VERVGTTSSARCKERIVDNGSAKRGSPGSSKGVSSSTTKHEGSNNGGSGNTSNHTSSQTGNKTDWETTSTGFLNVATSVVGDVTARNSTVLCDRTYDVKNEATTVRIANSVVANITAITWRSGVYTSFGQIESGSVANIFGAQVVVIAESGINWCEDTSNGRVTRVISTGISISTRRVGGRNTLSILYITREFTFIGGAIVAIITFGVS